VGCGRLGRVLDHETCYRAVHSRDARFDGYFFTAVTTTGIYCRPSCPAMTPKRTNVRFYPTAAAAQGAGFRACRRCRPDASPGSPEWNVRADVVARAVRLIGDGVVDRDGVAGLSDRLGYSERHLHRLVVAELGAGVQSLARAQRAQTARTLLETTDLPVTQVAFAAGFASVRQFNDTIQQVFATTPSGLRASRSKREGVEPGRVALRLPYREPCDVAATLRFLGARAVPGVEDYDGVTYRRALALPHGQAVVALAPADGHVRCELRLDDVRDLAVAVARCRRLLDLDADPVAVAEALGHDPLLADLVAAAPGRRVPGAVDGAEMAVRAVLGQQVSVAAARGTAGRLTARYGKPLTAPAGTITHVFPDAATLAGVDPLELPMPRARARAVVTLAAALAAGDIRLDPGADRGDTEAALLALPGIGPWTTAYLRMRALGDPDAFLPTDLGVRHALDRVGAPSDPRSAATLAEHWRPWRSYALMHLWAVLTPEETS
jgi:AraC family transcriptional regulator, regulatory protein of adaptative response / DNA-3-methyladenine glycosylase II